MAEEPYTTLRPFDALSPRGLAGKREYPFLRHHAPGVPHAAPIRDRDLARAGGLEMADQQAERVHVRGGREQVGAVEVRLDHHPLSACGGRSQRRQPATDPVRPVGGVHHEHLRGRCPCCPCSHRHDRTCLEKCPARDPHRHPLSLDDDELTRLSRCQRIT